MGGSSGDGNGSSDGTTGLCMLAWKKRTGIGGAWSSVVSGTTEKWERRWIVVSDNRILYYSLGNEDAPTPRGVLDLVEQSATIHVPATTSLRLPPRHKSSSSSSLQDGGSGSGPPTMYQLDITAQSYDGTSTVRWNLCFDTQQDQLHLLETVHNILYAGGQYHEKDVDRFEHDFEAGDHVYRWEMLVLPPIISPIQIHGIVLEAGRNCVIMADFGLTGYGKQEGASFNHAQDHNKSILAAWKKLRPKEDQRLNIVTLVDPKEIRKWKKANYDHNVTKADGRRRTRPQQSHSNGVIGGRLSKFFSNTGSKRSSEQHRTIQDNDSTVATDATVIVGMDEEEKDESSTTTNRRDKDESVEKSSTVSGRLSKFFQRSEIVKQDSVGTDGTVIAQESVDEEETTEIRSIDETTTDEEGSSSRNDNNVSRKLTTDESDVAKVQSKKSVGTRKESVRVETKEQRKSSTDLEANNGDASAYLSSKSIVKKDAELSGTDATDATVMSRQSGKDDAVEIQNPEQKEQLSGNEVETSKSEAPSPVASHRKQAPHTHPAHEELPKSDPTKIVLARAHFLLEYGEEILPPYHLFFSNSECIAVWCKTGRWSTLQTAVYLTGHSVGAAKSSTMATLGVVAAHAVLAPVVAVGGLIWVSAPMVILQKSQKKWDEATMKLTALFWEWAPPEVFVAAIENWSDIR